MERKDIVAVEADKLIYGADSDSFPASALGILSDYLYFPAIKEDWQSKFVPEEELEDPEGLVWKSYGPVVFVFSASGRSMLEYGNRHNEIREVYDRVLPIYFYNENFICLKTPTASLLTSAKFSYSVVHTWISGQIKILRNIGIHVSSLSDYNVLYNPSDNDIIFVEPFLWSRVEPLNNQEINDIISSLSLPYADKYRSLVQAKIDRDAKKK